MKSNLQKLSTPRYAKGKIVVVLWGLMARDGFSGFRWWMGAKSGDCVNVKSLAKSGSLYLVISNSEKRNCVLKYVLLFIVHCTIEICESLALTRVKTLLVFGTL